MHRRMYCMQQAHLHSTDLTSCLRYLNNLATQGLCVNVCHHSGAVYVPACIQTPVINCSLLDAVRGIRTHTGTHVCMYVCMYGSKCLLSADSLRRPKAALTCMRILCLAAVAAVADPRFSSKATYACLKGQVISLHAVGAARIKTNMPTGIPTMMIDISMTRPMVIIQLVPHRL